MMEIKIKTTVKAIEAVNVILKQAIDSLMDNGNIAKTMGLTAKDVVLAEQFRQRLLKEFLQKKKTRSKK
jgi:hypothetical protein